MVYRALADLALVVHLGFVLFALFGCLLAFRWKRVVWFHVPALTWGATVEFTGWTCPLIPLENFLREAGGGTAYTGDFIANYVTPILYSTTLTRDDQLLYGFTLLVINASLYSVLFYRSR